VEVFPFSLSELLNVAMGWLWDFLTAKKNKKVRQKIIKSATAVGKCVPVNAISAVNGIYRVTQIGNSVANAADSVARCADVVRYFQMFSGLMAVGNLVVAYQGVQALRLIAAHLMDINETLQAQTALMSMRKFPGPVYDMIVEATDNNPGHGILLASVLRLPSRHRLDWRLPPSRHGEAT